jgi:ABC-type methionine transport system ATPase subunit
MERKALHSISFKAKEGEIIGIIGRSGAGKSTLLRCINGLQTPTSGQVYFDGDYIQFEHKSKLQSIQRKIGFIWQNIICSYGFLL